MDPTLARIFGFDEETLAANRSGVLHDKQTQLLLSSPGFQALLNLFVMASGVAYLLWSWWNHHPTGLVGPMAVLLVGVSGVTSFNHYRRSRQFQREAPELVMECVTGIVRLEQVSPKKQRGRGARKLMVGEHEFLVTKGAHQLLQPAEGQQLRVYWCREPVHQRKQVLSAEFVG